MIGLEHVQDLIEDLQVGFEKTFQESAAAASTPAAADWDQEAGYLS